VHPILRTLRLLALYAGVAYATYVFLHWYRPALELGTWTIGLLALPLSCGLGYLAGSRHYLEEARLVLESKDRPRLVDGQRVVVTGPVEALDVLVRSPIAQKDCVAYQYLIDHEVKHPGEPPTRVRDYWGMSMVPWQVRTPAGAVRILGYANLEAFPEDVEPEQAYPAAEAYLRRTSFRRPVSAGERLGSLAEPLTTESDTFHDDICAELSQPSREELRKLQVSERCLTVGQTVCAAGQYSAAKQALVPTTNGVKQLRISTYSPELWASENTDWAKTYVRWGTGFLILGCACVLGTRWC
jgi:hypothetical protein